MLIQRFDFTFGNVPIGQKPIGKPKTRSLKKNFFNIYHLSKNGREFNIGSFSVIGMCDPFPDDEFQPTEYIVPSDVLLVDNCAKHKHTLIYHECRYIEF